MRQEEENQNYDCSADVRAAQIKQVECNLFCSTRANIKYSLASKFLLNVVYLHINKKRYRTLSDSSPLGKKTQLFAFGLIAALLL